MKMSMAVKTLSALLRGLNMLAVTVLTSQEKAAQWKLLAATVTTRVLVVNQELKLRELIEEDALNLYREPFLVTSETTLAEELLLRPEPIQLLLVSCQSNLTSALDRRFYTFCRGEEENALYERYEVNDVKKETLLAKADKDLEEWTYKEESFWERRSNLEGAELIAAVDTFLPFCKVCHFIFFPCLFKRHVSRRSIRTRSFPRPARNTFA